MLPLHLRAIYHRGDRDAYDGLSKLAAFKSPPLREAIKVTLKVSHNLYASALPLLLAVKNGQRTQPEGMRKQAKILEKLGVHETASMVRYAIRSGLIEP